MALVTKGCTRIAFTIKSPNVNYLATLNLGRDYAVQKIIPIANKILLRTLLFILAVMAILFLFASPKVGSDGTQVQTFAVRGVNVVDVQNGSLLENQTVIVEDGRIVSIGAATSVSVPVEVQVIDASGQYMVPGFWDMHAHLTTRSFIKTYGPVSIANGVLFARELSGDCLSNCVFDRDITEVRALQADAARGEVLMPMLSSVASFAVGGPRLIGPNASKEEIIANPVTAEGGARLHKLEKERGVDFIKTYGSMSRPAYFAMAKAAATDGVRLGGHIPQAVFLEEAIKAGHRSVEHARDLPMVCSDYEPLYRKRWDEVDTLSRTEARAHRNSDSDFSKEASITGHYAEIIANFDEAKCNRILDLWAKSDTYYVPTHITRLAEAISPDRPFLTDPRAEYANALAVNIGWEEEAASYEEAFTADPALGQAYMDFFKHGIKLTGVAHRAGVKILVGTDVGDLLVYPGFSFHEEMTYLVESGMSSADVLRAATLSAAEFEGMEKDHGSIDVGKIANFSLLKRNPLSDIKNTSSIEAVYHNGRFFDRTKLDDVLADARSRSSGFKYYLENGWFLLTAALPALL